MTHSYLFHFVETLSKFEATCEMRVGRTDPTICVDKNVLKKYTSSDVFIYFIEAYLLIIYYFNTLKLQFSN